MQKNSNLQLINEMHIMGINPNFTKRHKYNESTVTDLFVIVAGLNERSVKTRFEIFWLFAELKISHYHHQCSL